MAFKFSRADLSRTLNRILPPSSPTVAQPGVLLDEVRLTQPLQPTSWAIDQYHFLIIPAVLGNPAVDTLAVPVGKFWWVQCAHVLKIAASLQVHQAGITSLLKTTGAGNVVQQVPYSGNVADFYAAAYVGAIAWLERPLLLPANYALRGFVGQNLPDANLQLQLELQYLELDVGDVYPG